MSDETRLSHIDADGQTRMVDVAEKPDTKRVARAACTVHLAASTVTMLREAALPKGDALATAKIAGILAAKQTHALIPLCHPLPLSFVDVTFDVTDTAIHVIAEARTTGKTGVEMEALTAASIAALTIHDMCKAVQKDITTTDLRVIHKSGGRSGTYDAE